MDKLLKKLCGCFLLCYNLNMKINEFLQNIGLNEKEAAIYLELIKYEHLSPTDISKKTGINRTTIYPVIEQLVEKRLVKEVEGLKTSKFKAEPAERLRTYFEEKKAQYEEQERLLDDVVPQIRGLEKKGESNTPVIKYYSGRQGVLDSVKDFLEIIPENSEVSMVYSQDFVEKMFSPSETKIARSLRLKKNIKVKTIYSYSKGEKEKSGSSERVKVPNSFEGKIFGDIGISDDVVRFYAGDSQVFAVIVKSKEVATTLKALHELAFQAIKNNKI